MANIKAELEALQKRVQQLTAALEQQSKVKTRDELLEQIAKHLAGVEFPAEVKRIKGQVVAEIAGDRYKIHVSGPHQRIRASGKRVA